VVITCTFVAACPDDNEFFCASLFDVDGDRIVILLMN
jgi:hypothetical protein